MTRSASRWIRRLSAAALIVLSFASYFHVRSTRHWLARVSFDLTGKALDKELSILDLLSHSLQEHAEQVAFSADAEAYEVTRMYRRYLDREPDPSGFEYFTGVIAATGDRESARIGFVSSREFLERMQARDARGWVIGLFRVLLRREPSEIDEAEIAPYIRALSDGMNRVDVSGQVLRSEERRCVWIGESFFELAGVVPRDAQLQWWTAMMMRGAKEEQIVGEILATPEYQRAEVNANRLDSPPSLPEPISDYCGKHHRLRS